MSDPLMDAADAAWDAVEAECRRYVYDATAKIAARQVMTRAMLAVAGEASARNLAAAHDPHRDDDGT